MLLEDLGYTANLENYRKENRLDSFGIGRIISEHKERYVVRTELKEFEAEVVGNLRFAAKDRSDFPAVGDWVAVTEYEENKVLIYAIYPRKTILERTAVDKSGEKQIIAANIDFALIVQAMDRDFNLNRMERYLTICYHAGVKPILVFNKIDLITDKAMDQLLKAVRTRVKELPVVAISNKTRAGYGDLLKHIEKGNTYCLLGSSGVGKSTLLNNMAGEALMKTSTVSSSTKKGKHITSHRELFVLEGGGLIIDNPGMRELGIADAAGGMESVFEELVILSGKCRFQDCTHVHESGCAVIQALEKGEIDRAYYENYLKMMKEKNHFESSMVKKKRKDKQMGRILKEYKNFKRLND